MIAAAAGILVLPAALRGQVITHASAPVASYVVGFAQNFGAAMYVFNGPDQNNNLANCGTARGAALNYGLYLTCRPLDEARDDLNVGAEDTWVTLFEKSGDPVLTFVLPGRSLEDNMTACRQVLEVPTHVDWTCRAGGPQELGKLASNS
jgi:hypothetical protein